MTGKHAAPAPLVQEKNETPADGMYLQRAYMASFGRFVDRTLGPFKPGLNVVYGANEAGKTTARAFIGGVLFGWPDARGGRNAYKPRVAEREGSLQFFDCESGEVGTVSRARNAEGLLGDDAFVQRACGDIDRETFQTLFSLDADELRSLEAAPDISAKLLTAGSGTKESPAHVLAALDLRISACMSRASAETESFPNLKNELDGVKVRIADARAEATELKAEDLELRQLSAQREQSDRALAKVNAKIEAIAACRGELTRIDSSRQRLEGELAQARADMRACEAQAAVELSTYDAVPRVSADEEASLRAAVEPLAARESAAAQRLDAARTAYEQARGLWEAGRDAAKPRGEAASKAAWLPAASCALAAVLIVAGFVLAFSQPGALIVAAIAMLAGVAAMAFGAVLFARSKAKAEPSAEADSARAAMVACKSTFDSRESEAMMLADEVRTALANLGFPTPAPNARMALRDLNLMRDARRLESHFNESRELIGIRVDNASAELARLEQHRDACLASAGLAATASPEDIEVAAASLSRQRSELDAGLARMNARIGQLRQILSDGERETELDLLKTQRAQIITRQNESAERLAKLLLARRMVQGAIDAWGTESQPEVYAKASALLSLMTGGAWTGVRLDGSDVCAVDSFGAKFPPRLLSLGTCQQLYLALRIALLECVPEVGASVPVLCDDILVNFDDARRAGAAKALAELAETRQVIVFTCHKEVVSTFAEQARHVHVLEL